MRASYNLESVSLDFRVNEIEFLQAQFRPAGNDATDFQIVIEHPFLGSFAVHEEFDFELRADDDAGTWEKVSLEQLKMAILRASRFVRVQPSRGEYERTSERLGVLSGAHPVAPNEHLPRISIQGDSSHLERAQVALSLGKVRYKIIGGIGSQGRVWGHATVLVDSLLVARTHLHRAGFLQSSKSTLVLTDSENGWKICLLEARLEKNHQPSLDG
jgi:hypothetical protein